MFNFFELTSYNYTVIQLMLKLKDFEAFECVQQWRKNKRWKERERALWEIYFTKSLRNELQSSNYLYRINTSRTFQRL